MTQAIINMGIFDMNCSRNWYGAENDQHQLIGKEMLPDALWSYQKSMFAFEYDGGTENKNQLNARIEKIDFVMQKFGIKNFSIVWITRSKKRLVTIQSCCERIKDNVFFTTLNNCGELWQDYDSKEIPVTKPCY